MSRVSASPPKATVDFQNLFGREGPISDIGRWLFDHLVGERQELVRHGDTEHLGSFQIDH